MTEMRAALDRIEGGEAAIAGLARAAQDAGLDHRARLKAFSVARAEAARRLDAAVAAELAPLKLDAARFRTAVVRLPEERWGPQGVDAAEFLISTNPAPIAPLAKIASGGELRVSSSRSRWRLRKKAARRR
jgi:DNA repair protein RecN (Recombination protein N)